MLATCAHSTTFAGEATLILKTVILLLLGVISIEFSPTFAADDIAYEQRLRLINEAKDIFIRRNICTDRERDCREKELVLSARSYTGNLFEFYEIDADAVREIIGLCLTEYERSNRKITMTIVFYKEPHQARVGKAFKLKTPKPYIEITLKGAQ